MSQPGSPTQTCTVNSGNGAVTNANVGNVAVICSTNAYSIAGTVSGLAGSGLVLQINGGGDLPIAADGSFTFTTTPIASGATYAVTVKPMSQPGNPSQTCSVNSGNGNVTNANVESVAVICSTNAYYIGGTVSGLKGSLVLQNNGDSDELTISADDVLPLPIRLPAAPATTSPSSPCGVAIHVALHIQQQRHNENLDHFEQRRLYLGRRDCL